MKLLMILLLAGLSVQSQEMSVNDTTPPLPSMPPIDLASAQVAPAKEEIKLKPERWRMTGNRWITGSLVFVAGASKGFNETLMFHWKIFKRSFPNANPNWFNPNVSWRNKYKNGDPDAGEKFPLSTSVLVMFTDQYHLNNFINKAAWTSTLVIKIGEGKKPFKQYLLDFLYYTFCHQAGFALTYYPFKYRGN